MQLSTQSTSDWKVVWLGCAVSIAAARLPADAAETFPYVAYVNEADSYIRSGPGNQHYATGRLPAGYAVEVYRHDGGGWCAIRPTEESFSLAPAHQLRILDSRTAEVAASGVVARVGSSLSRQRSAVQVLLERGELVQVVEQPAPGELWVKIAPPAGEFRWIPARRLSRTPPMESAAAPDSGSQWQSRAGGRPMAASSALTQPMIEADRGRPFSHRETAPVEGLSATAGGSVNPAWSPEVVQAGFNEGVAPTPETEEIEVIPGSPADARLAQQPAAAGDAGNVAATSGQARIRFEGLSASIDPIHPRIAEMQLRLSQIVVQPPREWQLSGLREETAALLAQEKQPDLREQLRDLLDRIATFESVQTRYNNVSATPLAQVPASMPPGPVGSAEPAEGMTGQTSEVLARVRTDLGADPSITPTPGDRAPAGAPTATEALYDAVGTLKPVVSRREQAPRFALVDDHGDVVTFVTASADVNLQPFVGKRIGVRGSRGFMPEYRRAHVMASRVTPLEERLIK